MKQIIKTILIALSLGAVLYTCGDDSTGNNYIDLYNPGIMRTDEFGNELGGDTTDWCYRGTGTFKFFAAYPNPTMGNITHIRFNVPVTDSIKLFILRSSTDSIIYFNGQTMPGNYEVTINDSTRSFLNTYQRVYITSKEFSPGTNCSFYGDIRFEQ